MKKLLLFLICFVPLLALAADLPPLPADTASYWEYLIAGLSPIIVYLVRKIVPTIPTALLPSMTPFIGLGLGLILNALANAHLSYVDMAKAGALAVFIRETFHQWVTKRQEKEG